MKLAREDVSHLIEVLEAAVTKGINWDDAYELAFMLNALKTKIVKKRNYKRTAPPFLPPLPPLFFLDCLFKS